MTTIALVCAAGVSGSFLAHRLRAALPDVAFEVTTLAELPVVLHRVHAIVLARQVADALDGVRAIADGRPVVVLAEGAATPAGTAAAVATVRTVLEGTRPPAHAVLPIHHIHTIHRSKEAP